MLSTSLAATCIADDQPREKFMPVHKNPQTGEFSIGQFCKNQLSPNRSSEHDPHIPIPYTNYQINAAQHGHYFGIGASIYSMYYSKAHTPHARARGIPVTIPLEPSRYDVSALLFFAYRLCTGEEKLLFSKRDDNPQEQTQE